MDTQQIVLDKDAYHAMHLGVLAAGGLRRGPGNPWSGDDSCGCLLSVAAMLDGRLADIYAEPKADEPVLSALYAAFGMPPASPNPDPIWELNDMTCYTYAPLSWEEFCRLTDIVPSN